MTTPSQDAAVTAMAQTTSPHAFAQMTGDPHVTVYINGTELPVCFTFSSGNDGDNVQLNSLCF